MRLPKFCSVTELNATSVNRLKGSGCSIEVQVYDYFNGFSGVNTGVWIYHKIYGISSIIRGKFMACFSIVPMEKQAINFPKIVLQNTQSCCQVCSNFRYGKWLKNTEI